MAPRAMGFHPLYLLRRAKMGCSKKPRQVRDGKKHGPKTVRVKSHPRSKPSKCR